MSAVLSERPAPGVMRLVLNRPEQRNALDLVLARELREALDDASADDEVRAVLIAANGPSFSAGGDIKAMLEAGAAGRPELLGQLTNHFHAAVTAIAQMPKPVVAAARGGAGGGGMALLMACDLAVVDEAGRFVMGYCGIGLSPDGGSTHHLVRMVGLQRATELCLLNPQLDGKRLVELGLAARAAAADKVDEEALGLATKLAAGPTRAFARTKELLRAGRPLVEALAAEQESIVGLSGDADAGEGIEAFVEKREPRFRGR